MANNLKSYYLNKSFFSRLENDSFVGFPIYGSMMQNKIGRDSYLPIVESPGILYFINTDKDLESFVEYALLNSIKSAWPIMGFIYLAAAGSGILMWALVSFG